MAVLKYGEANDYKHKLVCLDEYNILGNVLIMEGVQLTLTFNSEDEADSFLKNNPHVLHKYQAWIRPQKYIKDINKIQEVEQIKHTLEIN